MTDVDPIVSGLCIRKLEWKTGFCRLLENSSFDLLFYLEINLSYYLLKNLRTCRYRKIDLSSLLWIFKFFINNFDNKSANAIDL